MATANTIISLALRTSGATGVGQSPLPQDLADAQAVLNGMISNWQNERQVAQIPGTLPTFPDLTTDVPFWNQWFNLAHMGLASALRSLYQLPADEALDKKVASTYALLQANNRQQLVGPTISASDQNGYGLVFLALRAAGRVSDQQGVSATSQDVTDALNILNEMLSEWQQYRNVQVIPGALPTITDPAAQIDLTPGLASAIVWNLAVRVRSAFGLQEDKYQVDRAAQSLALFQANNLQQQAPAVGTGLNTPLQIIYAALRAAGRVTDAQGVAQTSQDFADALGALQAMMGQWQKKRWLTIDLQDMVCRSNGNTWYTVGFEGDFNGIRPDRIESAFVRVNQPVVTLAGIGIYDPGWTIPEQPVAPNAVDYPLEVITSREEWNQLAFKGIGSFPTAVFYDSSYPQGRVHIWPVPNSAAYEIHLSVPGALPNFASVNDPINLPAEYAEALVHNLALRLVTMMGSKASPILADMARASLNTVRMANTQVPTLTMPYGMPVGGAYGFGYGGYGFGGFAGGVFPAIPTPLVTVLTDCLQGIGIGPVQAVTAVNAVTDDWSGNYVYDDVTGNVIVPGGGTVSVALPGTLLTNAAGAILTRPDGTQLLRPTTITTTPSNPSNPTTPTNPTKPLTPTPATFDQSTYDGPDVYQ